MDCHSVVLVRFKEMGLAWACIAMMSCNRTLVDRAQLHAKRTKVFSKSPPEGQRSGRSSWKFREVAEN